MSAELAIGILIGLIARDLWPTIRRGRRRGDDDRRPPQLRG